VADGDHEGIAFDLETKLSAVAGGFPGSHDPEVKQPAPGRRIYPPRCTQCEGKGRITKSTDPNKKAIP
jgi:hypothetical protein